MSQSLRRKIGRSYFFNHEIGIGRGLFSYVTCGLGIREKTKEERLKEFRRRNFWLIDVFQNPIKNVRAESTVSRSLEHNCCRRTRPPACRRSTILVNRR